MYQKYLLLIVLFMVACSEKDAVLVQNLNLRVKSDTAFSKLTLLGNIDAKMTGEHQIEGFGGGYRFEIDDQKMRYNIFEGSADQQILFNDFKNILKMNLPGEGLTLDRSRDGGATYEQAFKLRKDTSVWENGYTSLSNSFYNGYFTSIDSGWVFSYLSSSWSGSNYPTGIRVYKVEGSHIFKISESSKRYLPVDAHFENKLVGKLLVRDYRPYETYSPYSVLRTFDGGKTWEGKFPLSTIGASSAKIRYLNTGKYIIFTDRYIYTTHDDCESFKETIIDGQTDIKIKDIHVVNENLVYMAVRSGNDKYGDTGYILKSTDIGRTWQRVSQALLYVEKIHFYNHLHGVAVDRNIVQTTHDGGQNWELLIFPFK